MYVAEASLDRYIDRVRAIPTLSREEEHEIALASVAGDESAAERLVEANLRYVVAIALQYRRYGVPLGELISEGNLGLVTAVQKFDPHRGTRFVTYAGYWIRAFVLETVVRSASMVGGGSGPLRSKLFFRLRRERARVANLVADPTERIRIMAERFDTTPERMEQLLGRLEGGDLSLDVETHHESGLTLLDTLTHPGEDAFSTFTGHERRVALEQRLSDAMGSLDPRERYIVEQRMLRDEEMSLADLGRELGVSRERARQLEARAKEKLKAHLREFAPAA
ncbi:MAG: sigma-70 family RNA polymerase sigma factor [Polyangiales bacterium]